MKNQSTIALLIAGAILSAGTVACSKIEKETPAIEGSAQVEQSLNEKISSLLQPYGFSGEQIETVQKDSATFELTFDEIKSTVDAVVASEQCTETAEHDCSVDLVASITGSLNVLCLRKGEEIKAKLKAELEALQAEKSAEAPKTEETQQTETTPATGNGN